MTMLSEAEVQRRYYAHTASDYDAMHVDEKDEHLLALSFMVGLLDYLEVRSILDIGSGTGRAVRYVKQHRPDVRIVGIEPVAELRAIGYAKGLSTKELIEGDATKLCFDTADFDLVCEFGVLHHVRRPEVVVAEMLRVAKKAVFISDSNNFGQGSSLSRACKQMLNALGLWKVANLLKTRGRGYTISEGDGLGYSYSVFNDFRKLKSQCGTIHLLNTRDGNINPYRSASHVALLGIKK
jgi:ubiquinone/menaquinone biosynthesis C-methylase UbiE